MHQPLSKAQIVAINDADRIVGGSSGSVIPLTSTDKSVSDDSDWFADMAHALLVPDRGLALHMLSKLSDPRQCARYANGSVKPPGYLVRAVLRADEGEPFAAFMLDGVSWWNDQRRHADIGRRVLGIIKRE